MKIRYLGTAAYDGIPALFCNCEHCTLARKLGGKNLRARTQALVNDDILIDFNPDTFMNAMRFNVDMSKIKYLLVTHSHSDHFTPYDINIRQDSYSRNRVEPIMHVFGNEGVKALYDYAIESGAIADFTVIEPFKTYKLDNYTVTPIKADHMSTEQAVLYVIQNGGKTLLYCNDTGMLPDEDIDYLKKSGIKFDFIGFDCTYVLATGHRHMSLKDNYETLKLLKNIGAADDNTKAIVTHFSHWNTPSHEFIEREAAKYGLVAAYDGITVEI